MNYSPTISLECPHCDTKCQFTKQTHNFCTFDNKHHLSYVCTNCRGEIVTKWNSNTSNLQAFEQNPNGYRQKLELYYPLVGDLKPRVDLSLIKNEEVREDFREAIGCYNNGFYNSCMMMARRALQQEMLINEATGNNLYEQIESMGISRKLKILLHKIKNFGNHGAHPDFCLYDENGDEIKDKKEFARLSLEFLDRYCADEYEIDVLTEKAPKSKKELESDK